MPREHKTSTCCQIVRTAAQLERAMKRLRCILAELRLKFTQDDCRNCWEPRPIAVQWADACARLSVIEAILGKGGNLVPHNFARFGLNTEEISGEEMEQAKQRGDIYVAKKPCGCVVAAYQELKRGERRATQVLADWVRDGFVVEKSASPIDVPVECEHHRAIRAQSRQYSDGLSDDADRQFLEETDPLRIEPINEP